MSSDVVIRAEGLGKKYVIGHETRRPRDDTFRDAIVRTAQGIVRSAADMARGQQILSGEEREDFWALRDVNFEIRRGDVVGVIGRNGAGKSTLLKILSRITEPSEGKVTLHGRVASLLEVGTGFHPELTGRENIFLNGAILGMSRAEIRAKFDEIVEFAGVERFLDTPVKRYSSGMSVRLAFAVAAHLEPEILIIDEVLAVGDAEFQQKCLGKMDEVASSGRTVLFVSHNLTAVMNVCKLGLHIQSGSATPIRPVRDVLQEYREAVAKKFSEGALGKSTKPARIARVAWVADLSSGAGADTMIAEIDIELSRPESGLNLSLAAIDEQEIVAFSTNPQDSRVPMPKAPGEYRYRVSLPRSVFLNKTYRLRATLWSELSGVIDADESLEFANVDLPDFARGAPRRNGALLVKCDWSMTSDAVQARAQIG